MFGKIFWKKWMGLCCDMAFKRCMANKYFCQKVVITNPTEIDWLAVMNGFWEWVSGV
jgi:hypothetical protein